MLEGTLYSTDFNFELTLKLVKLTFQLSPSMLRAWPVIDLSVVKFTQIEWLPWFG